MWNLSNLNNQNYFYPRNIDWLIRIGTPWTENVTNDTFAVWGSSAFYGSLNSTTFNATDIFQRKARVNDSILLDNYITALNLTTLNTLSNYKIDTTFSKTNFSNYTTDAKWNESISLLNRTGTKTVSNRDWFIFNFTGDSGQNSVFNVSFNGNFSIMSTSRGIIAQYNGSWYFKGTEATRVII